MCLRHHIREREREVYLVNYRQSILKSRRRVVGGAAAPGVGVIRGLIRGR